MPGKIIRQGLPFSNVVANGIATATITPGNTMELIRLRLGGTTFNNSHVKRIKIKANGKTIHETTGEILKTINSYRGNGDLMVETMVGSTVADEILSKFLDIYFADYSQNNELDRMVGAFDTSVGIAQISAEVTIEGATAPELKMVLIESAQQKDKSGAMAPYAPLMSKILHYPVNPTTGGRVPVNLPFGPGNGSIIKRVHVFHDGSMTGAKVKVDGLEIFEQDNLENWYEQTRHGRIPQEGHFCIDFCVDGAIAKALDTRTARSIEWLFDFNGASPIDVYVEYLDPLGNM